MCGLSQDARKFRSKPSLQPRMDCDSTSTRVTGAHFLACLYLCCPYVNTSCIQKQHFLLIQHIYCSYLGNYFGAYMYLTGRCSVQHQPRPIGICLWVCVGVWVCGCVCGCVGVGVCVCACVCVRVLRAASLSPAAKMPGEPGQRENF